MTTGAQMKTTCDASWMSRSKIDRIGTDWPSTNAKFPSNAHQPRPSTACHHRIFGQRALITATPSSAAAARAEPRFGALLQDARDQRVRQAGVLVDVRI